MSDNSIQIIANSIQIVAILVIIMLIIVSFTLIVLAVIKADKEKAIVKLFGESLKNFEFESDKLSLKSGKVSYVPPKNAKNGLLKLIKVICKK